MNAVDLSGNVAVITGATSDICLAVARELHDRGMKLVLAGRSYERLEQIHEETGASVVVGDPADPNLPVRLLRAARFEYGRCDVVLNGAGTVEVGDIDTIDIERVCMMARINVEASYRVAYTFLRHFLGQSTGHLINISNVREADEDPTAGAYVGTKYAVEVLSEALRVEVSGASVAVSCIDLGRGQTNSHSDWNVHATGTMSISDPPHGGNVAQRVASLLTNPRSVVPPVQAADEESHMNAIVDRY